MYQWEFDFLEKLNRLNQKQRRLIKIMNRFPEGWLAEHHNKSYPELYLHTYKDGVRKVKYLSAERDKELIKDLKDKATRLPEIKNELRFIRQVIKRLTPVAKDILKNFQMPKKSLPPVASQKQEYVKELTVKTNRGEMVRSKSEKFIADALFNLNLDYRYEAEIELNGIKFYPDFTIVSPLNGQVYFWEHLGLSTEKYMRDWEFKKRIYGENDIKESKNLIVTTEDNINQFEYIVAIAFSPERYKDIFSSGG